MNCFIIMPFAADFDDVHSAIKSAVQKALPECRCFRLDEDRPAGRITDRLVDELNNASFCVADLTGLKPNVMWEVGYAMALKCPTVLVSQSVDDLPFDIRDMQTHKYDRTNLAKSLVGPLNQMVTDTLSIVQRDVKKDPKQELVGQLMIQIAELKMMVAGAVETWKAPTSQMNDQSQYEKAIDAMTGCWVNDASGSHMYVEKVNGQLVAPYCYRGDGNITGVYYNWKQVNEYWFARYAWLDALSIYGFSFLKHDSVDQLHGAWWSGKDKQITPVSPPEHKGVPALWRRTQVGKMPSWATKFLKRVTRNGLPKSLPYSSER